MIGFERRAGDADLPLFDAVLLQFGAPESGELGGGDAVAREVTVQRVRAPVARLAEIQQQHRAPAPAEHQGRAQACRPASDDGDIEHSAGPLQDHHHE